MDRPDSSFQPAGVFVTGDRSNGLEPSVSANWRQVLSASLRNAIATADPSPRLVRIGVPVGDVDPYAWLGHQSGPYRTIWQSRHRSRLRAMAGSAVRFDGDALPDFRSLYDSMAEILRRPGDDMRFFGGLRFDGVRAIEREWAGFGGYSFVLPRFELHLSGTQAQLHCNLLLPEDTTKIEQVIRTLFEMKMPAEGLHGELPVPIRRSDLPERESWLEQVQQALDSFETGRFEKVVLARRVEFLFDDPPEPLLLLKQLAAATPHCFHFHFESSDGISFLGATPERLLFRNGIQVDTEAVAGTRPRGETELVDEQYRNALLGSEKDRREQAYVRDTIHDILKKYCESVTVDTEASEMRLARGRHLVSRITGILDSPISDLELLQKLHPTPAVGGFPTTRALESIRTLETFDRGWYAGPVGWIGRDSAEFAVALRCGLVSGSRLALYSGAGIVNGSVPEAEWDEIEQKIVDFLSVLGLEI